jgi:hypothetical protein
VISLPSLFPLPPVPTLRDLRQFNQTHLRCKSMDEQIRERGAVYRDAKMCPWKPAGDSLRKGGGGL